MQQSDQLLLTSIRDFIPFAESISTLNNIKSDEIFGICLSFLEAMSIPTEDIRAIEKQKFRSTTKLNQKLHKELEIELELNDLLNPTVTFVRKTLLTFLSKLGSNENIADKGGNSTEEDVEKRRKKKQLSAWIDDEWIHPSLVSENRPSYQAYLFPLSINRKSIKANLLPQLLSPSTKSCILPILATSLNHNLMRQKQTEQNAGITKKRPQENAALQTNKLISGNFDDWKMAEQKLNRIKRKLEKDKENVEAAKKVEEEEKIKQMMEEKREELAVVQSVFQAEVEEKIEEKEKEKETKPQLAISQSTASVASESVISDNPFEKLQRQAQEKKVQYEKMIQSLLTELNQKKQESSVLSLKKEKIVIQIQKDQERLIQMKTRTDQLKKQVQKKQLVLTAVESPKQIQQEVEKFQQDIATMEEELKKEVQTSTQAIETMKVESEKKLQALRELKMKLHRIETEYKEVCQEIEEKIERKSKIRISKSGVSRNYYSKKISEIDKRWRQTQKEVQKIKRDLEIMKEKTQNISNVSDSMQKEILNYMAAQRNPKTEQQAKALKQVFVKCQSCYKSTLETLNKINEIKEETREYEMKVHALSSQNYKQGIERLNAALAEMKKEVQ